MKRLGLDDDEEIDELLNLFANGYFSFFTATTPELRIVKEDPDNDKFIECAVALAAEYIITGDKAVLEIENYMGIIILRPGDFIKLYNIK